MSVKTKLEAYRDSDHVPVTGKMRIKLKKIKKWKNNIKLNLALLRTNNKLKEEYKHHSKEKVECCGKNH